MARRDRDESPVQSGFLGTTTAPVAADPIRKATPGGNSGSSRGATQSTRTDYGISEVVDRPGYGPNFVAPTQGGGWDRGASSSSLSSMGDQKMGGPNHTIVRDATAVDNPVTDDGTKGNPDNGPTQPTAAQTEAQRRALNVAQLAAVTGRSVAFHHVNWGNRGLGPTRTTTQTTTQTTRHKNTGLLGTLDQTKPSSTTVQPSKAAEPKQTNQTKERDPTRCKPRPKDNKPKGGGGGARKSFVPWCG